MPRDVVITLNVQKGVNEQWVPQLQGKGLYLLETMHYVGVILLETIVNKLFAIHRAFFYAFIFTNETEQDRLELTVVTDLEATFKINISSRTYPSVLNISP